MQKKQKKESEYLLMFLIGKELVREERLTGKSMKELLRGRRNRKYLLSCYYFAKNIIRYIEWKMGEVFSIESVPLYATRIDFFTFESDRKPEIINERMWRIARDYFFKLTNLIEERIRREGKIVYGLLKAKGWRVLEKYLFSTISVLEVLDALANAYSTEEIVEIAKQMDKELGRILLQKKIAVIRYKMYTTKNENSRKKLKEAEKKLVELWKVM